MISSFFVFNMYLIYSNYEFAPADIYFVEKIINEI